MKKVITMTLFAAIAGGSLGAQAYDADDWIVRVGAATVAPNDDSDSISVPTDPPTVLRGVEVDDDTQLGIIPAFMITDNFGLELLLATPFEHDIDVKGTNLSAGSTKHLPPTLSLQWYPRGGNDGWQPYVGLGINYTYFFDEEVDGDLEGALDALIGAQRVDLELDDSFGFAAQAGVDIPFGEHWGFNAGVWYIDIDTTATIKTDVGRVKFDVDIDPWVYNIGIVYKF
ncbi:MAG: OmpW family outer membrane protein [Pseudomonadota bacterium]